jgi:hypothetical protein
MSNSSILHSLQTLARRSRRGQSVVELALMLPLRPCLAILDLGCLFAAAVSRNVHPGRCCPESGVTS